MRQFNFSFIKSGVGTSLVIDGSNSPYEIAPGAVLEYDTIDIMSDGYAYASQGTQPVVFKYKSRFKIHTGGKLENKFWMDPWNGPYSYSIDGHSFEFNQVVSGGGSGGASGASFAAGGSGGYGSGGGGGGSTMGNPGYTTGGGDGGVDLGGESYYLGGVIFGNPGQDAAPAENNANPVVAAGGSGGALGQPGGWLIFIGNVPIDVTEADDACIDVSGGPGGDGGEGGNATNDAGSAYAGGGGGAGSGGPGGQVDQRSRTGEDPLTGTKVSANGGLAGASANGGVASGIVDAADGDSSGEGDTGSAGTVTFELF